MSRRADLNARARLYMAAPFKQVLRNYPRFLTNSSDTRRKLSVHCRPDAEITLYRPPIRNVFDLGSARRAGRDARPRPLRLVALGTVEPRKNFVAAASILASLHSRGFPDATLDILGRQGWGGHWQQLQGSHGVTLHGYQPAGQVRAILDAADFFICTSHDEGLGLPLLEAQYGGLPIIAPDAPVFHEVLGESGLFITPTDPPRAAEQTVAALSSAGWRQRFVSLAADNLRRWNRLAASDRAAVIELIARLSGRHPSATPSCRSDMP
ncbi:glycosyltransferase family 4 protein [Tardiphaga sp.]|uniref:glycosyltransferase family 4 protein n=1 Tax=Tardiphaga sp. TaxID=1926292 RepID=UPI0025D4C96A|nr:glycosyltransferase family 4 protein [Tardiphaga sp.]